MIRRIIVPLDGSESAEQALRFAEVLPGESIALLVCLPIVNDIHGLVDPAMAAAARRQAREDAEAYLDRTGAALGRGGREIEHWIEPGDPAERIVDNATADDLVVMATHGFSAGKRAVFGSVTDRVVRHATAPVLIVREGNVPVERAGISRIVVPLDGSNRAEAALPLAVEIATALHVPVHLVRALDMNLLNEAIRTGTYAAAAYAASVDDVRSAVESYLEKQQHALGGRGLDLTYEVLDGPAASAIIGALRAGDLVVMTSHGHGGIRRWLLGSVAEKLVRLAPAPVLVARAA